MEKQINWGKSNKAMENVIIGLLIWLIVNSVILLSIGAYGFIIGSKYSSYLKKYDYEKWWRLSCNQISHLRYIWGKEDNQDEYIRKCKLKLRKNMKFICVCLGSLVISIIIVIILMRLSPGWRTT